MGKKRVRTYEELNAAEKLVYNLEKSRKGSAPSIVTESSNEAPGYDLDSGDRHIEVKWRKNEKKDVKESWLEFTSNESTSLLRDDKFYLYLVEGTPQDVLDEELKGTRVLAIPRNDLLAMCQPKVVLRITGLSGEEKRKRWNWASQIRSGES